MERAMQDSPIYVYEFYVMDYGWHMFSTIPETIEKLSKEPDEYRLLQDFLSFHDKAERAAKKCQVTPGFCTEIYAMPLIDYIDPSFALIWKGGRGGWCIAISQRPLPWIGDNSEVSCHLKEVLHDI